MLEHVGQVIHRHLEVVVQDAGVVTRVLLRGEGVHVASDRVEALRDVQRASRRRALEQEMLQEVTGPADAMDLVPRAREHPEPE